MQPLFNTLKTYFHIFPSLSIAIFIQSSRVFHPLFSIAISSRIQRSIDSIHRCFHTVLQEVLKLYPIHVKSPDGTLQPEIRSNSRYYPWFVAHPSHDKYINKKIDMFEEMSLVCGNDRARGDCAKSFEDINVDCSSEKGNDNDIEEPSKEKDAVGETSQVKVSRTRNRSFDVQDMVGDISTKLGEVAAAISKIADSRLDISKLYEEIIVIEGYEEEFLGEAFDYLVQSDTLANAFMAKSQNLRKLWLERFKRRQ